MKKIKLFITATVLSLAFIPTLSNAANPPENANSVAVTPAEKAKGDLILSRLHEIEVMDKSSMNKSEKRRLVKEVRSLEKEMKANNNGVYLSVGVIIILILLLILLV